MLYQCLFIYFGNNIKNFSMRTIWREIIPLCLLISNYLPNIFLDLGYDS